MTDGSRIKKIFTFDRELSLEKLKVPLQKTVNNFPLYQEIMEQTINYN